MLPFGMAMFLAAAECIPAILSLVSMWNKILEINWKTRRGRGDPVKEQSEDQGIIPGTNGATLKGMKDVNQAIRSLLSAVEVPVFGGAWLAVLVIGEINFWSPQLKYHTEPMSSIGTQFLSFLDKPMLTSSGQWGTILGTGMAGLGSLYVWLADSNGELTHIATNHSSCPHCHGRGQTDGMLDEGESPRASTAYQAHRESYSGSDARLSTVDSTGELVARRKIANALGKIGNYFGNPAKDPFGAGDFRTGAWPRIPGEARRNDRMAEHDDRYSIMEEQSSLRESQDEGPSSDNVSMTATRALPTSPTSIPPQVRILRAHANSLPSQNSSRHSSFDQSRQAEGAHDPRVRSTERRATLEVPPSAHHRF